MGSNADMNATDCCELFSESYELTKLPAVKKAERDVLGCDYGGTSWTTRQQAEQIIKALRLRPGIHLLDIGAGAGWPGLFLADRAGCDVTLVDLPANGLQMARDRAREDGIDQRINPIVASGASLPFGDRSFDAISHSDVLCCLPEKRAVLTECRRVAKPGSEMLFSVIATRPGLVAGDRERAVEAGPPFVDAPVDYADLLEQSGWTVTAQQDVTSEHRRSLCTLVTAFEKNSELAEALGAEYVLESCGRRRDQVAAIDEGLLVRQTFVASLS
jgi:ubiquinone/menaquinone biosynthesis C-methylase UbiE